MVSPSNRLQVHITSQCTSDSKPGQTRYDWLLPLYIPSSVEAEIVVAAAGLPLVPQDPVVGCFVQLVLLHLT